MIKLTVVDNYTSVTIKRKDDGDGLDINDFLDLCKCAALGLSYQQRSWEDAILDAAEEIKEMNGPDVEFSFEPGSDDYIEPAPAPKPWENI